MGEKFDMKDLKREPSKDLLKNSPGGSPKPEPKKKVKKEKPKLGRNPLPKDERLDKKITVNLTMEEYDRLQETSREYLGIKLPQLVRALLKKHNEI